MLDPSDYRPGDETLHGSPFAEEQDCSPEEEAEWQAEEEFARDGYNLAWWLDNRAITAECVGIAAELLEPDHDIQAASADRLLVSVFHPLTKEAVRLQCAHELYQRYMAAMKAEIVERAAELLRKAEKERDALIPVPETLDCGCVGTKIADAMWCAACNKG